MKSSSGSPSLKVLISDMPNPRSDLCLFGVAESALRQTIPRVYV
jgi:hypothetical protein